MRRIDVLRGWRQRWETPDARPIARQIASELIGGSPTTASPFGSVEGRTDLRGLQVDLLTARQDPMYQRVSTSCGMWDSLDLSGGGLSGMNWTGLRVTNSVLDDAQLDGLRCWDVGVVDCQARRASLRGAQIGWPTEVHPKSVWRRVDLEGADLRGLHGMVHLEDVNLRRAKFGATNLGFSDLVRVRFHGAVKGLTIGSLRADQRPKEWLLHGVDLSEARLQELNLLAVNLGSPDVDIRLPDADEDWTVQAWPAFLDRVATNSTPQLRASSDVWVSHARREMGPRQTSGFVNLRDAQRFAGDEFVQLLRECR